MKKTFLINHYRSVEHLRSRLFQKRFSGGALRGNAQFIVAGRKAVRNQDKQAGRLIKGDVFRWKLGFCLGIHIGKVDTAVCMLSRNLDVRTFDFRCLAFGKRAAGIVIRSIYQSKYSHRAGLLAEYLHFGFGNALSQLCALGHIHIDAVLFLVPSFVFKGALYHRAGYHEAHIYAVAVEDYLL